MDKPFRVHLRLLALFLPLTAVLYIGAEALNPKGTDRLVDTMAAAFQVLPIAARHPAQLYVSGSLTIAALGALAVSYAAIATLVRGRGWMLATAGALLGVQPGVHVRLFRFRVRRAGGHGICPVAEPDRTALADGPVHRRPGNRRGAVRQRTRRHLVHAPLRGRDGPAGRTYLAGGSTAGAGRVLSAAAGRRPAR